MARFASEAELETFLGRLDPDYGQYASAVWQNGVRTAHQLANADKEDLVAAGVTSAIHAKDIKARAEPQGGRLSYFISPQAQAMVRAAVFSIMDEGNNGVGLGVFFSKSKAVTADHNLTVSQGVGTQVVVQIPGLHEQLTMAVSARDTAMDYAILQSSTDHAYLPVYADPPEQLVGKDLVLAGYRIGIEDYAPMFSRKLGFIKADAITLSNHNNHLLFRCTTFAGDSGAVLILKDGCLVGIHQEAVNALRERLQHAKVVKDRLSEVEQSIDALVSGGTAQGCCALLSSVFAK